jgi:2-polyprenyl-6-hydroxyphenyl methylase / 3-demethylubiquinone-9 3-methyltransferase
MPGTWHKPAMEHAPAASTSLDASEVAKFSALAEEWWNPVGKFAPLHKFNPVRLAFIRDACGGHFSRDTRSVRPFKGLMLLDIGCGGGLLSEPLARLGFAVTGIDPSPKNVAIATAHAAAGALQVDYTCTTAEALGGTSREFDVVLNMEVIEHVADVRGFVRACSKLVRPGGLIFTATLNRTLKSLALAKIGAEYILRWLPPGTHDWNRFIEPRTLCRILEESGLNPLKTQGVAFDPLAWDWRLSNDVDVNYIVVASR